MQRKKNEDNGIRQQRHQMKRVMIRKHTGQDDMVLKVKPKKALGEQELRIR